MLDVWPGFPPYPVPTALEVPPMQGGPDAVREVAWSDRAQNGARSAGRLSPVVRVLASALLATTVGACGVIDPGPRADGGPAFEDGIPELPEPANGSAVPVDVRERRLGGSLLLVPVTIEGSQPLTFVLDTGASVTAIDRAVADELGLATTGSDGQVFGVSGETVGTGVSVDAWTLGEVELEARDIVALDLSEGIGADADLGVDGLLGGDVLSAFGTFTLDYDEGVLVLEAAPSP
jgi:hypothetical protein